MMSSRFWSEGLWNRITGLAETSARACVAVPFIGEGASRRLPLGAGDTLVTRMDLGTVKAGLVHPREIVSFLDRGVDVHAVPTLHAKVFVFGRRAIIGSANVSEFSEHHWIEAACETTDPATVSAARQFVLGLRGTVVEREFATSLIAHWRPPRIDGIKPRQAVKPLLLQAPPTGASQRRARSNVVGHPSQPVHEQDSKEAADLSDAQKVQFEWWTAFREALIAANMVPRVQKAQPKDFYNIALGRNGITVAGVVRVRLGRVLVQLYLTGRHGGDMAYDRLLRERRQIEREIGHAVEWNPNPGAKDRIIQSVRAADLSDRSTWPDHISWMVSEVGVFWRVFRDRVLSL